MMKMLLGQPKEHVKEFVASIEPKTKKRIIWTLAVLFVLQLYFVRELIAEELLFGMLFAAMFLLAAICYLLGTISVDGLDWMEAGARLIASTARRYYNLLEEISKKPFRHPHSESAR
jgi:hypothetical protein